VKTDWKGRRVGVVYGGLSSEREVSLESGKGVIEALRGRGHDVAAIDWAPGTHLPSLLADGEVEVVWLALHGTYGEDGAVQGLLTCLGIPFTGSGILASALAMDKVASKRIFESNRVPTPAWRLVDPDREVAAQLAGLELPLVVKPALEGSSVGVTIVKRPDQLGPAIELARRHRGPILVEAFIAGAEVNTAILGDEVLGSIEIRPAGEFYDYEAKYLRDDTQYLIPTTLPAATVAALEEVARAAHRALGCSAYSRVDLLVAADGQASVLEVNTLPGMTSHSLLPKIAAHRGIDYATLCERILAMAALGR
jgi:D-alanine-D-alanine ligase